MIRSTLLAIGLTFAVASTAAAKDCILDGDIYDANDEAVNALYDCMQEKMITGYTKGDSEVAAQFRDWAVSATRPAVHGTHGERFLLTFVNDIGKDTYLAFADENVDMPIGGVLAKESIKIGKKGKARVGPLFIMEKVGVDAAPETNGWLYAGVQPNGKPLKFKQSFCHNCHSGWDFQDYMAYPVEEVRVSAN